MHYCVGFSQIRSHMKARISVMTGGLDVNMEWEVSAQKNC